MGTSSDEELRSLLQRAHRSAPMVGPDLHELELRVHSNARRARVRAMAAGLAFAVGGSIALVAFMGPLVGRGGGQNATIAPVAEPSPSGRLLLGQDAGSEILDIATGTVEKLPADLVPLGFTADGSGILASVLEHEPSGLGYSTRLVLVDAATMEQTTVAEVSFPASFENAWPSPDATSLAYTFSPDVHETARLLRQDEVPMYQLCVAQLLDGTTKCYPEAGPVYAADWSADGQRILLGEPGGEPMKVLDVASGTVSDVVSARDPAVLRLFEEAGLTGVKAVQFIEPSWSPSGNFIGTIAMSGETIPLIFASDGTLVAAGRPNAEFRRFAWSPTQDVLAYAVGVLGESTPPPGAFLLDAVTGQDRPVPWPPGQAMPEVLTVVWSPDRKWLALGKQSAIRIVDPAGVVPPQELRPFVTPGALIDWGR